MGGIGFFVIAAGEATVSVGGKTPATLRRGDHFGEIPFYDFQAFARGEF